MSFDLVIFDCDGVLVDTEPLLNRVYVAMLGEFGIRVDPDETLREFSGAAMSARLEAFHARFGWRPGDDFKNKFYARLGDLIRTELAPVEGVSELLDALTVPSCVASNAMHSEIRKRLRRVGFLARFADAILSAEDVERPKPAPDIYLLAAERRRASPERCIVIEDSVPGVVAAKAAGMTVFGYAKLTDRGALEKAGATTFAAMSELAARLSESSYGVCRAETSPRPAP